jgi:hypothetical protein
MLGNSGTDARFPSKVRQNVVVGWCIDLLREQEVAGSNPVAPTMQDEPLQCFALQGLFVARVREESGGQRGDASTTGRKTRKTWKKRTRILRATD